MHNMSMKSFFVLGLLVWGVGMSMPVSAGVLASVNGKSITDEDFQALIAGLPMQQRELAQKEPATKKRIIQDLIDQELMVQEAAGEKLDSSREFKDSLQLMRKQALVNLLVSKKLAPKVTEAAVKDFYQRNKTRYSTDQVHAQHILLATQADAESVLAEAKRGVDFQRLAEQRSKDPSAKTTRGDVGYFSRNMFDEAFTRAAFTAGIGEIVGPVKTSFGFHVIKVVDRKVGKTPEFVEVEQQVRSDVQRDMLRNLVTDLRRKAKIKE
jgi:peptidyl-prolyl cis-trans isomerase C